MGRLLTRKYVTHVIFLALMFAALLGLSLAYMVRETNRTEVQSTHRLLSGALKAQLNQIAIRADQAAESNYGGAYKLTDSSGRVKITFANGTMMQATAPELMSADVQMLLRKSDASGQAISGLARTKTGIAFVGVDKLRLLPPRLGGSFPQEGPYFAVISQKLDHALLNQIGAGIYADDLRLTSIASQVEGRPLRNERGDLIGRLSWQPVRSGSISLANILPFILLGVLIHSLVAFALVRKGLLALRELGKLALVDSLSALPNRRSLRKALALRLQRKETVSLAMMDLDGFKVINDNFGHQIGDRLIREVADLLKEKVGEDGFVARLGGDEFAILISGESAARRIEAISNAIINRFAKPFRIDERTVAVGISIGLVSDGSEPLSSSELMRRADVALYAAKRAGKMRINWFDDQLDQLQARAHGIEHELRTALDNDEFSLVYQPMMATDQVSVRAVEALLRWHNPARGDVPPSEFIPIAEETGLIDRIGMWVIGQACRDGLNWPEVQVTINISPAQLRNPDFTNRLGGLLKQTAFPAHRLELEITEPYLVADPETARRVIADIQRLGVHVVLDDFGSGFASIGFLRGFAFRKIKVHRMLIKDSEYSEAARAVLQANVAVARALNMGVVAGGVETQAQADLMRVAGCDEFQGWHFSAAVPAEAIDQKIRSADRKRA